MSDVTGSAADPCAPGPCISPEQHILPNLPTDTAASAFAAAVCRWHHAHNGQPIPCVQADREAAALTGLLEHAGYRLTAKGEPR